MPGEDPTELVRRLETGSSSAADRLVPEVYDELRRLARSYLSRERRDHTLQPTALVHEAYLRLIDQSRVEWKGRSHFLAIGARMMRRLLVDHARGRRRDKRGGDRRRVTLEDHLALLDGPLELEEVLALDSALEELRSLDERQARVVELRFFGGLAVDEVANVLGVSKRTVEGDWTHARAWLRRRLGASRSGDPRRSPSP